MSFESTFSMILPLATSRISSNVGTRSPVGTVACRNCSFRICSSVISATFPVPLVVRLTVASCMITYTPSDVRRTSSSTPCTPAAIDAFSAATEFSGSVRCRHLCANTTTAGSDASRIARTAATAVSDDSPRAPATATNTPANTNATYDGRQRIINDLPWFGSSRAGERRKAKERVRDRFQCVEQSNSIPSPLSGSAWHL